MHQYGGTIGTSRLPIYRLSGCDKNHMLPRPVVSCRPGQYGYHIMNYSSWFKELVHDVEHITLKF